MKFGIIGQIKHIILSFTFLMVAAAGSYTAVAQANHYDVGDLYYFPDGTYGVVCYVDPDNPHKGWVVSMSDLGGGKAYALMKENRNNYPSLLNLETVDNYNSWGQMDGWHPHGKENTEKIYNSSHINRALHDALPYYQGWYIPDAEQLRIWFSLIPYLRTKQGQPGYSTLILPSENLNNDSNDETKQCFYWSSTPVNNGEYSLGHGFAVLNHVTGQIGAQPQGDKQNGNNNVIDLTSLRHVRLVRNFQVEDAEFFWVQEDPNLKEPEIYVQPQETTVYPWRVIFNGDTFNRTGWAIVYPKYDTTQTPIFYDTVCQSDIPYTSTTNPHFNNIDISRPKDTTAFVTISTVNGCDSSVRIKLHVNPVYEFHTTAFICREEAPYEWRGNYYYNTGEYVEHFKTVNGCDCDSTYYLHLTVAPMPTFEVSNRQLCEGISPFEMTLYCDSCGDVTDPVLYQETFDLVNDNSGTNITDKISSKTTMFQSGVRVNSGGNHTVWLGNSNNTGSLTSRAHDLSSPFAMTLRLKAWDNTRNVWVKISVDQLYDTTIEVSGNIYKDYNLHFGRATASSTFTIATQAVTMPGQSYPERRVYIDKVTIWDTTSCSFLWMEGSNVVSTRATLSVENPHSATYTVSAKSVNHCAVTKSFTVTVSDVLRGDEYVETCEVPYVWDNVPYYATPEEAPTKLYHTTSRCDSIVTLHLTINQPVAESPEVAICESELPYTWRDTIFQKGTESGTFVFHEKTIAGCDSTVTLTLTVKENPPVSITGPTEVCENGSVTLTASGANTYKWSTNAETAAITVSPTSDSTFTVMGTASNGCSSTKSTTVTVNPLPEVTVTGNNTVCRGESTELDVSGYTSVQWVPSSGTTYIPSTNKWRITVDNTRSYTVIVSDLHNCTNSAQYTVYVNPLPQVKINGDNAVCKGQSVGLTATGATSYVWNTTEQGSHIDVSPTETTTYSVTGEDANGCVNTAQKTVTVNEATTGETSAFACDSYDWYEHHNITSSGDYTHTFTNGNANGCDSTVTLHLTVGHSNTGDTIAFACDSFDWYEHKNITSSTNALTHTFTNASGCDSVVTLKLTVGHSNTGDTIAFACDSFDWYEHKNITSSTNTLTHTFTNASGCDSVVTLKLTVGHSNTGDTIAFACDSFDWYEHKNITSSTNTLTHTFTNASGCDSVVTLKLTVGHSNTGDTIAFACDSFDWYEHKNITSSTNTLTHTFTNASGCDSVVTLKLTVGHSNTGDTIAFACDSFDWYEHKNITSSTNTLTHTFTNASGCDSVVTLKLTVGHSNTGDTIAFACDSFDWYEHKNITSSTNALTHTFTNASGCDSVVTLKLTVGHSNTGDTIAFACDSFDWYEYKNITESTNELTHTFTNASGCDSVVTLKLTVGHSNTGDTIAFACDSFDWYEYTGITESTNELTHTFTNVSGCDSVVTLKLTVGHSNTGDTIAFACDSFDWYEYKNITESTNELTHTFTNASGCDSVVTLKLTVGHSNTGDTIAFACDSFDWYEYKNITESTNELTHTFTNASGCDSVVTLKLTVGHSNTGDTIAFACDSFDWYEYTGITESTNELTHTFTNVSGCDSVVTLKLTVGHSNTGDTIAFACDSFDWYEYSGITESTNELTHTFTNVSGCDSVVTLKLTVGHSNTGDTIAFACDSFDWYEYKNITESTNELTHTFTNASGCDSVVTLKLTVGHSNTGDTIAFACDSFDWYEYTGITESTNELTHTFTNVSGCDSVVTLKLTVGHSNTGDTIAFACDSFDWYEYTGITESTNELTHTFTNVSGCDSVVTLKLTVGHSNTGDTIAFACDSFDWYEHKNITSSTNTLTHTFTNASGCDSVVTLKLTVGHSNTGDTIAFACDSFDWYEYTDITESTNELTHTFTNVSGCDSVVTLKLTVGHSNTGDTIAFACDSFDWYEHKNITSSTNALTHTFTNASGCDSVVTLKLTVGHSNTGDTIAFACDSFDWYEHKNITSSTNTLTHTFTNASGCDSVVTLKLTVGHSNTGDTIAFACDSFDWYEHKNITSSTNTLTHTFTNASGCDSVVTLKLTVNYSNTGTDTQEGCDSYTWNDIIYYLSGVYHQTLTNAAGCDSVVTMNLTIHPSYVKNLTDTICYGSRYTEHGQDTVPVRPATADPNEPFVVNLTHLFKSQYNCDSTVNVALTVLPKVKITPQDYTVCPLRDTLTMTAAISPVMMEEHLVRWRYLQDVTNYQDVVTAGKDTYMASIPFKCDTTILYSVVYQDAYCRDSVEARVRVYDQYNPVISGTLDDLFVTGCQKEDAPAAYASATALAAVVNVSDDCTPLDKLKLTYSDAVVSSTCSLVVKRTYTVTDTCGKTASIEQNITIHRPDTFSITTVKTDTTVNCIGQAIEPAGKLPTVKDGCGNVLQPAPNPVVVSDVQDCNGTVTYTYTYRNCAQVDTHWTYTYHVKLPDLKPNPDGAAEAPCVVDATRPEAPLLTDACGNEISSEFIDSTAVTNTDGTGTVTFRFRYTDCAKHDSIWKFVYTLKPNQFTPKKNDTSAVNCIAQISAPSVTITNCGAPVTITPGVNTSTLSDGCGDTTFVFHYSVNGQNYTYSYTYKVKPADFTITAANGSKTVNCPDSVKAPELPVVTDQCGRVLQPQDPVIEGDPECEGVVTYKYTYTDCAGNSHDWRFTYTIVLPAMTVPANQDSTVHCLNDVVEPTPPTLKDTCGRTVTAVLNANNPVMVVHNNGHDTVTYNYTYTDCAEHTYPWKFTYIVTPEGFTPVANQDSTVHCQQDVKSPVEPVIKVCGNNITLTRDSIVDHHVDCGETVYYYSYTVNDTAYNWKYTWHIDQFNFTLPQAVDSTVHCVNDAVASAITLPTVKDSCGNTLSPGALTIDTTYNGCEGKLVFNYPYTDCAGHTNIWKFTYNIKLPTTLNVPQDRVVSVSCPVDARRPKADTITDVCGNKIAPVYMDSIPDVNPNGTGTVTFHFRYTDCAHNDSVWTFVYNLTPGDFDPIAYDTTYVHCLNKVVVPALPERTYCGANITFTPGTNTGDLSGGCGDSTFVYHYTVNDKHYTWRYTYRMEPEPFEVPANADSLVMCASDVKRPVPPTVTNSCENIIVPTFAVQDSTTHGCKDTVVYVYTYEDCVPAHTKTWTYTYYINDTVNPVITGTLTDQTLTGCSRAVIPAAYMDVHTMVNAVAGLTISDNCVAEADLVLTSEDVVDSACAINVTRTYTVKDVCGNAAQISQHFTINRADGITVDAELTEKTVNCLAQANVANVTMPVVKDACENTLTPDTVIIDSTQYNGCQGDLVFNYKYSDCAGHQQTWPFTFHIVLPTTLNVPADRAGTATCLVDVKRPKVDTITDVCGKRIIPDYVDSTAAVNTDGTGTVTYRYSYTDCAGNSAIWKFVYTLTPDQFNPKPNDTTYVHCVAAIHEPTKPIIVNCGDTITLYDGTNTSTLSNGCGDSTYVYTYTVNGENYTWSYTYRVTPEPFEVPANADTLVMCASDVKRPTPPAVTGCAPIVPTFAIQDSTTHGCKDTVVYVYTYEDCVPAHTKTWTYTYYIQDTVKPVITGTLTDQTLTGCSRAVIPAAYTDVHTMVNAVSGLTISDNCVAEADLVLSSEDVVDSACVINVTRTYTVTDRCGNIAQISQHFTINHADAITVTQVSTEKTVNCLAQATAAGITLPTVKDACENTLTPDTVIIDSTHYNGCQGDLVFNYYYSDCANHQQTWSFTYHILLPTQLTIPADREGTATCLVDVRRPQVDTITDVCGKRIIPDYVDSTAAVNTDGTGTVTYRYRYTDCAGNSAIWKFVCTLTPGQFTPEENDTTYVHCVAAIHAPTKPIIVNCGDTITLYDGTNTSTLSNGCGDSTYVYTYTVNGEDYTWSYTYRVTPEPFVVPANADTLVMCASDVKRPTPPAVTGCAPIVPTFAIQDSTTHGCKDTVVYVYTYEDCVPAHTKTWTYTYYIQDTVKPVITGTLTDQTLTGCSRAVIPAAYTDVHTMVNAVSGLTISDNCVAEADLVLSSEDVVDSACVINVTRTYTVKDVCGNAAQISQHFTVNHADAITVAQVSTEKTVNCLAQATAAGITLPTVKDACENTLTPDTVIIDSTQYNGCQGDLVFNYYYSDCANHQQTWSFTYHILLPTQLTIPADREGTATCLVDVRRPQVDTITDVCGNRIVPMFKDSIADVNLVTGTGTVTFHYTYTDCAGHQAVWTYVYTLTPGQFTPEENDTTYVHCVAAIHAPTKPIIVNCGDTITLYDGTNTSTLSNGCGDSTFVYTYTVNGENYTWSYTYRVTPEPFVVPANVVNRVQCIAEVTRPDAPTVTNACQEPIVPTFAVDSTTHGCADTVVYRYTYQDCVPAHTRTWTSTYYVKDTIKPAFTVPANNTICREQDGSYEADTLSMGGPRNLSDNCVVAADLQVTYSDVVTHHVSSQDTLIRTWTVSDHCNDSVQVQQILINPVTASDTFATAYEPFTWHDSTYRVSPATNPTYTYHGGNQYGCDSTVTLHLTLILNTTGDTTATACEEFTWHDSTYTVTPATDPTYTMVGANQYGNDSIVTLHLTIYHKSYFDTIATGCYEFTWHDSTYTETPSELPTFTMEGANVHGCDSIVRLHLTIYKPENHSDTIKQCDGQPYTWPRNGVTYDHSTYDLFAHYDEETGCTHYDTLHLTIGKSSEVTIDTFACASYQWGDEHLTQSGVYTKVFTNASGCDSIVHLTLDITGGTEEIYEYDTVEVNDIQAGRVVWRGDTIREPGFHTDTAYAAAGSDECDTVYHVVVTVLCPNFRAHSIPISTVCGDDGVIIVVVDHPADSMKNVDYGINIQGNITWQPDSIFTHVPSGFRAIIVRDTTYQCFTMANVVVPAPTQRSMTCPPPVSITLNYGDPLPYYISPEVLGTPELTGWRMQFTEISNNIPDGYRFPEGITTIQWVADDTASYCQPDTCEQVVNITFPGCPDAVDCENNLYHGVRIGTYCWTQRNLVSGHYQNADGSCGDEIPCIYEYTSTLHPNTQQNVDIFGRLYCYEAAIHDSAVNEYGHIQGICPAGWYLPTPEQYEELNTYGAAALKSPLYWTDGGGYNTTGFTWLPAGRWNGSAQRFEGLLSEGYFWSVEVVNGEVVSKPYLILHDCDYSREFNNYSGQGFSVRCIKEKD